MEVTLRTDGEAAEAVCEFLYRAFGRGVSASMALAADPEGAWEEGSPPVVVRAILYPGAGGEAARRKLEEGLWHLGRLRPVGRPMFRELGPEDPALPALLRKGQVPPIRIGQRLVIKPSSSGWNPSPGDVAIQLEPGVAFGWGFHPSTRLCLILLEAHLRPGMEVLDLGSGSGILSLAAAGLGAARVDARDIDPAAVEATRENAGRNGMAGRIRATGGSLPDEGRYDLILCNILADAIVDLLGQGLADRLAAGGIFLASGVLENRFEDVQAALGARGLWILEKREEGDWVAVAARLQAG